MQVQEVMNRDIQIIQSQQSLMEAAKMMRDGDFGALPVADRDQIVGLVTDRDIVVRGLTNDKDAHEMRIRDVMTPQILTCFEDDDVDRVAQLMSDRQVRRVLVINRNSKKLAGIIALADLARRNESAEGAGIAMTKISEERHDETGARQ